MGYNTNYNLRCDLMIAGKAVKLVDDAPLLDVIEDLRQYSEEANYSLDYNGSSSGKEARWYRHEEELLIFSQQHPNILFTLHGEGEESGDVWNKYFLNGKVQIARASMEIAPFYPAKLANLTE